MDFERFMMTLGFAILGSIIIKISIYFEVKNQISKFHSVITDVMKELSKVQNELITKLDNVDSKKESD